MKCELNVFKCGTQDLSEKNMAAFVLSYDLAKYNP